MLVRKAILLVLALLVGASPAAAESIRIPIPGLLGDYALHQDALTSGFSSRRQLSVPTGLSHFGAETATIELKGTLSHGVVRGDGILRPITESILDGDFNVFFAAGGHGTGSADYRLELSPSGNFERTWSFSVPFQPGIDDFPCLDCGPRTFAPEISLSFTPSWARLESQIPFLAPPADGDFRLTSDGLLAVAPAIGTVTEAYLVIEHRFIPEPYTLAFVAAGIPLGILGVVWRRCRRSVGRGVEITR